jgi:hypothetical protein
MRAVDGCHKLALAAMDSSVVFICLFITVLLLIVLFASRSASKLWSKGFLYLGVRVTPPTKSLM